MPFRADSAMASAHSLSTTLAAGALVQLLSPSPGPDGHDSGPLQDYNLFLELTSLEFRVIDRDTWRYEDGEHSATPPFSVLGVAAKPHVLVT